LSARRRAVPAVEALEHRDAAAVVVPGYLTWSIVPDGTAVVGGPSVLRSAMAAKDPAWEAKVRRAMAEWSRALGVAIAYVPDSGPLGSTIRVGGSIVPGTNVAAWAYYPCPCPEGSDITINVAQDWGSVDLYTVMLHELGHAVAGLDHGAAPIMGPYRGPVAGLSAADVAAARASVVVLASPVGVLSKGV
jgi:hypothetical protein